MLQTADLTIRLNAADDVIIARTELPKGTEVISEKIKVSGVIPAGHKVATCALKVGDPVRRYNQIIGFVTQNIQPGDHVHVHNLAMGDFERDYAFCEDFVPSVVNPNPATFMGIKRSDGRVATRNYLGVISSVNCSAHVCRLIAKFFDDEFLAQYPNIDGVVPIHHRTGCGMGAEGEPIEYLRRTLGGYAIHPNFYSTLLIGLGCEANQINNLLAAQGLTRSDRLKAFTIQETGGTRKTVQQGIDLIKEMLPDANKVTREVVPASHLILGLECGGSDGYSGISANPALGAAADLLVQNGGTAILSETPEVYGAEHLLTRRAATKEVGEKLVRRIKWWEDYTTRLGGEMNNNPSPGNKAGGLTTILEKSLGAVAKGGTQGMMDVYEYAEQVTAKGFVFMDTPGYDPVSVTGHVAGGANIACFTTGRGSAYGCKPSPSIKLATNSALFEKQEDDMDINCGTIIDGTATVDQVGQQIFDRILEVASGNQSKSEQWGYGEDEFAPWVLGPTM
ncbi:MAG: altronate dehydratase family protein [Betaproteobacteria bacterium]|jgi:altronate hydrolase